MKVIVGTLFVTLFILDHASATQKREVALTFDDVPFESTLHFETNQRTNELIRKLGVLVDG